MAPGGFASIHFARSLSAPKIEKRVAELDTKSRIPTVNDTNPSVGSQNKTNSTTKLLATDSVPVITTTHDDQSAQPIVDDLERVQQLLRITSSDFVSHPIQKSTVTPLSTSTSARADPTPETERLQERDTSRRKYSSEGKVKVMVEASNQLTPSERLEVLRIIRGQAKQRGKLRIEMLSRETWW